MDFPLLSVIVFLPAAGALVILFLRDDTAVSCAARPVAVVGLRLSPALLPVVRPHPPALPEIPQSCAFGDELPFVFGLDEQADFTVGYLSAPIGTVEMIAIDIENP